MNLEKTHEDEAQRSREGVQGDVLYGVHDEDCTRLVPVLGEKLDRVAFLVVRDGGCYFIIIVSRGVSTIAVKRGKRCMGRIRTVVHLDDGLVVRVYIGERG
jgi:hypothetical protein